MNRNLRSITVGPLPLTLAYAEPVASDPPLALLATQRGRDQAQASAYSTYTTSSGTNNNSDDAPIKDED